MTQLLVNAIADVTISDSDMVTLLDVAVKYKKEKVIEYLLSVVRHITYSVTSIAVYHHY
jgi:hypothetical protein